MILAEPPPSQGDLHFTLLGYPVRVHPWFWLSAVLLSGLGNPIDVATWVAAMLLCILLHEMGHAVVMRAYGYSPSIVLYSFGGLAIPHAGRYGVRRPGPWGQILISFAGPASGFLLAAALALGLYLAGYPLGFYLQVVPVVFDVPNRFLSGFLNSVLQITVMWGLLNLLPIYPLDGGQIAQQIFVLNDPRDAVRHSLILSVIVGGLMSVMAFLQWHNLYLAIFFVWMTYSNYMTLQSYQIRGGW